MAHKAELRAKVEKRRAQLKEALAAAERDSALGKRIDELRVVLQNVDDATQGGWDSVSEVTAAALAKWIETTESLILPHPAAGGAAPEGGATDFRWVSDAEANIRFAIPTSWVSRSKGKVVVVSSATQPGEHGVGMELVGITGGAAEGKAAEAEMLQAVGQAIEGAQITTPAKAVKQHGLTGFVFGGKGTKDGHAIDWFSAALGAGQDKGVLAVGFARADESPEKRKLMLAVLNSIQPITPDAPR
jgi:hypothetical protein